MFGRNREIKSEARIVNLTVKPQEGWAYLDQDTLKMLQHTPYEILNIRSLTDQFVLKDLQPYNSDAQVRITGGLHHMILSTEVESIFSDAQESVHFDNDNKISLAHITRANRVTVEDTASRLSLLASQTCDLTLRRADIQLASDMAKLKRIEGGAVTGFAQPYTTEVKTHINEIGKFLIAPMLDDDSFHEAMCIYNGNSRCFITSGKPVAMSQLTNTKSDKKILDTVKDDLKKWVMFDKSKKVDILNQFVDCVAEIELARQEKKQSSDTVFPRGGYSFIG